MKMKRYVGLAAVVIMWVGMMGSGTCGKQAMQRIDDATAAIESARDADAPRHAPKRFTTAEEKLKEAQDLYDGYRFRFAEESATEAETLAGEALELSMAAKTRIEEEARKAAEDEAKLAEAQNPSSLFDDDLNMEIGGDGPKFALKDINFGLDSDQLNQSAKEVLDHNAKWLLEHPNVKFEIEGHCDERGTDEYNQALGARRARAVYDHMAAKGVGADRMKTISYGESIPIDPGENESAWGRNRRAHFAVIN